MATKEEQEDPGAQAVAPEAPCPHQAQLAPTTTPEDPRDPTAKDPTQDLPMHQFHPMDPLEVQATPTRVDQAQDPDPCILQSGWVGQEAWQQAGQLWADQSPAVPRPPQLQLLQLLHQDLPEAGEQDQDTEARQEDHHGPAQPGQNSEAMDPGLSTALLREDHTLALQGGQDQGSDLPSDQIPLGGLRLDRWLRVEEKLIISQWTVWSRPSRC